MFPGVSGGSSHRSRGRFLSLGLGLCPPPTLPVVLCRPQASRLTSKLPACDPFQSQARLSSWAASSGQAISGFRQSQGDTSLPPRRLLHLAFLSGAGRVPEKPCREGVRGCGGVGVARGGSGDWLLQGQARTQGDRLPPTAAWGPWGGLSLGLPPASHAVRSGCVCPHPPRGPEAPASGGGRGSGSAPRRKSSAPPARLSFPGAVLALPLALTLPSGVHSRRPAPRRLPPSGGQEWSVCCENPGPGEQRVACQAGTSEVLGQLPSWAPGWPLPAPAPATLGPFAERSREQAGPHHVSAQRAVLGAAVCHLRAPVCSRRTQSPTSGLTALAEDAPVLCSQTFPRFYF